MEKTMDKIVTLAKTRGFIYPGSEIYGGLANTWDYGNLGVELKNNVKKAWWQKFVQENPYNVIAFQTEAYTSTAVLEITPKPDSTIRVMMAYYPSDEAIEIEAQSFEDFDRKGFVAVEWGGVEVEKP